MPKWKLAAALAVAVAVGCSGQDCCVDRYLPSYGLIYGTIRLNSQTPAPDVLVRAGDGLGVRTDSAGRYRLPTTMHGINAGTLPVDVKAFQFDAQGRLADSNSVQVQVPFFSTQPPRDSVRVDIVMPWH